MYQVQEWAEVRELHRQGVSGKAIARRLSMSRNTMARLLASEQPPRYERQAAGSQLDPFKGAVLEMLRQDASVPATVIREHLQRAGALAEQMRKLQVASPRPPRGGTVIGHLQLLSWKLQVWQVTSSQFAWHRCPTRRSRSRSPGSCAVDHPRRQNAVSELFALWW